jgi:Rod binding domain-containing protein
MDASLQGTGSLAVLQSAPPPTLPKIGKGGNMDKASKEFESMFMSQMLQPMFEGMDVNPLFGGGNGEKIMRSFLVQEYGKIASNNTHMGIADAVKSEMIRAQSHGAASKINVNNAFSQGGYSNVDQK